MRLRGWHITFGRNLMIIHSKQVWLHVTIIKKDYKILQLNGVDPKMKSWQVLRLLVRVGMEEMAIKGSLHTLDIQNWSYAIKSSLVPYPVHSILAGISPLCTGYHKRILRPADSVVNVITRIQGQHWPANFQWWLPTWKKYNLSHWYWFRCFIFVHELYFLSQTWSCITIFFF